MLTENCVAEQTDKYGDHYADIFQLRYLGKVQVKGKKQALKIHECFGGDLPESISSKSDYQADFKSAMQDFHDRKFTAAVTTLGQIFTKNPNDKTARLFFGKANQLMIQGVEENWSGVEMMLVK